MTTNERIHLLKAFFFARDDFVAARYSYTESATGRAVTIPRPAVGGERLDALLRYHLEGPASGLTPKIIFETRKPHGGGKGTAAAIGGERIGSFCLSADARVRWLCLDFDGGEHADALADPMTAAITAYRRARELEIPAYLECSGSGTGYHLWVFFESLTTPAVARKIALAIACTSGTHALTSGEAADPLTGRGVEIYPKAIAQRGRHLGNMVWLPWWHGAAPDGNTFVAVGDDGALTNIDPDDFEDMTAEEVDAALARIPAIDDPVVANSATGAKGRSSSRALSATNYDELADALSAVPNQDVSYDAYISLGMAIHAAFPNDAGLALWEGWCAKSGKNRAHENARKWNSFVSAGGGVGPATIFKLAGENGWRPRLAPSVSDAELREFCDVDPMEIVVAEREDEGAGSDLTPERRAIANVMIEAGDFVTINDVAESTGKNYKAAQRAIRRMIEAGLVVEEGRGKYCLAPETLAHLSPNPAVGDSVDRQDGEKAARPAPPVSKSAVSNAQGDSETAAQPVSNAQGDSPRGDTPPAAPVSNVSKTQPPVARIIPQIAVNNRQLRDVIADAWRVHHVHENSNPNPSFFLKNGTIVRIASTNIRGGGTRTAIEEIGDRAMYSHLTRIAGWIKSSDAGVANADPPPRVAEDMVTRPHPDLPPLHEVVTVPVFDRYARLISSAGYHRESQIFFDDRRRLFSDFAIPETPAPDDVARARDLLLDDLFVDFPFASVSDRAHAIAALILPFVRRIIAGPTPIHLVEAPSAGTGKTLIAECISLIFSGAPAPIMTISKQEDRVTDAITSLFQSGVQIACIDNISQRHGLDSANLAAAVTSETWSARQFHQQRMLVFPNDICWIATANNPDLSLELARRSIRIRIDSHLPRPWERDGFKHDPIKKWILENRSDLVRSCLTLIAHWIREGRPGTTRRLGSFESWSNVLGGILFAAQIPGFLENQTELYAAADNRSAEFSAFIEAWSQSEESAGARSSGDLAKFAVENNLLVESLGDASARSQSIRMGILLRENRDRVVNGFCIKMAIDGHSKAKLWALVRSNPLEEGAFDPAECAVCSEFDITQHTAEKSQLNLGLAECADSADRNTLYAGEISKPDNRTIGQPDTPSTRIGDIGENIPAHAAHSATSRKDDPISAACLENAKNHHAAHTANGDDLDLSRLPDTEEDDA